MGNYNCCFHEQSNNQAKLIDIQKNMLRSVDVSMTAAEMMLEEPGHVVSRLTDIRRDLRIAAMKADELLTAGGVYVLIPVSRVNGKVSEVEKEMIESLCGRRRSKRRSSTVLPVVAETPVAEEATENPFRLSEEASGIAIVIHWKPALESIEEGDLNCHEQ